MYVKHYFYTDVLKSLTLRGSLEPISRDVDPNALRGICGSFEAGGAVSFNNLFSSFFLVNTRVAGESSRRSFALFPEKFLFHRCGIKPGWLKQSRTGYKLLMPRVIPLSFCLYFAMYYLRESGV